MGGGAMTGIPLIAGLPPAENPAAIGTGIPVVKSFVPVSGIDSFLTKF
jgi:hypothetical protein